MGRSMVLHRGAGSGIGAAGAGAVPPQQQGIRRAQRLPPPPEQRLGRTESPSDGSLRRGGTRFYERLGAALRYLGCE